jgi:hypothetical protein
MATKYPLCNYDGIIKELQSGDSLPGGGGTGNIEDGTADGELAFWNDTASEWKHTETSELYWDDTNKRLTVGSGSAPQLTLKDGGDNTSARHSQLNFDFSDGTGPIIRARRPSGEDNEAAVLDFFVEGDTTRQYISIYPYDSPTDGRVVLNDSGSSVINTQIKADSSANAFFLQASDGAIGINTGSPKQPNGLQLNYGGGDEAEYGFITSIDGSYLLANAYYDGTWKRIETGYASQLLADDDGRCFLITAGTDSADSTITWNERLRATEVGIVINEIGVDYDFRVESDNETHALFVRGSDGQVGIGCAPSSNLHIQDSGNCSVEIEGTASIIKFYENDTTDYYYYAVLDGGSMSFRKASLSGSNTVLTMNQSGEVVMPFVYGDAVTPSYRDLYIQSDGQLGYLSSTIRYKTITNEDPNIDWLYDLNVKQFDHYNNEEKTGDYTKNEIGLIAEEVDELLTGNDMRKILVSYQRTEQEIDGEVVYGESDTPETVNYSRLIPVLVKAIQDLNERIKTLEDEICQLER